MSPCRSLAVAAALVVVSAAFPRLAAQAPTANTRTIYVTALDSKGVPVKDLAASDFIVKEEGRTQTVVHAEIATAPMTVVLMIDDSGLGLQSMREGAAAFITRMRGLAEIAVVTTGGRNIKVLDFTTSTAELVSAINRTYARNTTGAALLDGLAEVARVFIARESARPVIVSVAAESEESSQSRSAEVLGAIQRSRAQVYLVRLGRPIIGRSNAVGLERGESGLDEATQANAVFGQAPARSGGQIDHLANHTGIPKRMEAIATELAGQYVVTYAAPDVNAPDRRLSVETSRRGVKVRAPTRVGPPR